MFITDNPYQLNKFDKMFENCNCCGEKYEPEPGFFYGAMYVSYGLMVGWFVLTWVANSFIFKVETVPYLIFLGITIVSFTPLTFRISRLMWMNFFSKYDKTKGNCNPKS